MKIDSSPSVSILADQTEIKKEVNSENEVCENCKGWEKMLSNNYTGFCRNTKSSRNGFLKLSSDYCREFT